jgi:hypothetical protein
MCNRLDSANLILFTGLGFPDIVLATALECTRDALQGRLPPELSTITHAHVAMRLEKLLEASSR